MNLNSLSLCCQFVVYAMRDLVKYQLSSLYFDCALWTVFMLARLFWGALLSQRITLRYYNVFHWIAVITDAVRFSIVCALTILFCNISFHHNRLAIHCKSLLRLKSFQTFNNPLSSVLRRFCLLAPIRRSSWLEGSDGHSWCYEPLSDAARRQRFSLSCFSCLLSFPQKREKLIPKGKLPWYNQWSFLYRIMIMMINPLFAFFQLDKKNWQI